MIIYYPNYIIKGYKRYVKINIFNSTYLIGQQVNFDHIFIKICDKNKIEIKNDKYLKWKSPSLITNMVITFSKTNKLISLFSSLISLLENLICKHIVIFLVDFYTLYELKQIFGELSKRNIHSVLIFLDYAEEYFSDEFGDLINEIKLNFKIVIIKSPFNKNFDNIIHYRTERQISITNVKKTVVSFSSNIQMLTESQLHNTYFNRKLYIGPNGEIKNAPECHEIYGNLNDLKSLNDIKAIISKPDFQKYWFVHKDICDVCKDCEFRHMCVDNRLPYEREKDAWYHKIECNYNPYIAKWEGEEGYRTLGECGVISNEQTFSIDHEKIAKINAELWPEE